MSDKIKVKATKPGFYDNAYRAAGDVFEVEEAMFSDFWMEKEPVLQVQEQSPEAKAAERANANAALQDLGDALAGNPSAQFDAMSDDDLAAYFETVLGSKPGNMRRETQIARLTEKLNAD